MRFIQRLRTGFALLKDSILVLRHHPRLLLFPVVSGLSALAFLALLLGSTYGAWLATGNTIVVGAALFLGYLVTTFITVSFTAALIYESHQVFEGGDPDLKRGLSAAWDVKGKLFVWALISATVGLIINAIEGSDSRVGRILAAIIGVAWTVMTFFVVPTAVLDRDSSVKEMFTRSGSIFKSQWGETVIGFGAVRVIDGLFGIVGVGLGLLALEGLGSPILAVVLAVPFLITGAVLSSAVRGVIKTALYVYARDGRRPSEFDGEDFDNLGRSINGKSTGGQPPMGGI